MKLRALFLSTLIVTVFFMTRGMAAVKATQTTVAQSSFFKLCKEGGADEVSAALKAGAGANWRDSSGMTALMTAAAAGNRAVVKVLLKAGADIKKTTADKKTALLYAAKTSSDPWIIKDLLEAGADIYARDNERRSALMLAVMNPVVSVTMVLIDNGAPLNVTDKAESTALMLAAKAGNGDAVNQLIDAGARIEARDNARGTALVYAEKNTKLATDEALLKRLQGKSGAVALTPERFSVLCRWGTPGRVKAALNARTDPNAYWKGLAPLSWAAQQNNSTEVLELLLSYGAEIDALDPVHGTTALIQAAEKNTDPKIVAYLLGAGARADIKDSRGKTALHYASMNPAFYPADLRGLKAVAAAVSAAENRVKAEYESRLATEHQKNAALQRELNRLRPHASLENKLAPVPSEQKKQPAPK